MESAPNASSIYLRPVELLQRLIAFDTTNPPGNEAECISFINGLLTEAGIETTILAQAPNRPNLVARLAGQGNAAPLLLYGHVDVVTTKNQKKSRKTKSNKHSKKHRLFPLFCTVPQSLRQRFFRQLSRLQVTNYARLQSLP